MGDGLLLQGMVPRLCMSHVVIFMEVSLCKKKVQSLVQGVVVIDYHIKSVKCDCIIEFQISDFKSSRKSHVFGFGAFSLISGARSICSLFRTTMK